MRQASSANGLTLKLGGEKFLAANIPGARVSIAPDLALTGKLDSLALTGAVTIEDADVDLEKLKIAGSAQTSSDVVIVDPPRTGVSPVALRGITAWRSPRLVYVSCDPPTLARDAGTLIAAGYRLTAIEAFDLFPNTPHVEVIAVFDRGA